MALRLRRRTQLAEERSDRSRVPARGAGDGQPVAGERRRLASERAPAQAPGRRRVLAWRTRNAGAAAVGTAGAGVLLLARLVMAAATVIALLIALAIVLSDVGANGSNTIVKGVHEGANFFAGAFTGLIRFSGHPKRAITVDWGIALAVYLIVGSILASVIANIGRGGVRFERSHRVAPTP
jgi:hypothetical protein